MFSIIFLLTVIKAYNKKLELLVRKHSSNRSIVPSFDEAITQIYTPDTTTLIFDFPTNPLIYEVNIASIIKYNSIEYILSLATPASMRYCIKLPTNIPVPP